MLPLIIFSLFSFGMFLGSVVTPTTDPTTGQVSHDNQSKIYRLYLEQADEGAFTGTGFAIKTAKGKLLVTAAHVCSQDVTSLVYVNDKTKNTYRTSREEWQLYYGNDLCVVAKLADNVDAFELASEANKYETHYALGYPNAYPLTVTSGNLLGIVDLVIEALHVDISNCRGPVMYPITAKDEQGKIHHKCLFQVKMYNTTIPVISGSSGGPVVDSDYRVVGVVSITDEASPAHWAGAVPLEDLKLFLNGLK